MKLEPFWVLGAVGVTGAASAPVIVPYAHYEFMGALVAGGALALMNSLRKSRKAQVDTGEAALQAMMAFLGSMSLAFFFAPMLAGRELPLVHIDVTKAAAAFAITLTAMPIIEWLLAGEGFELIKNFIPSWLRKEKS